MGSQKVRHNLVTENNHDKNNTHTHTHTQASQMTPVVKRPPANAGDIRGSGLIPGSGRSPGGGHGNPLQYSFLKNPTDRGHWWARVCRVAESDRTEAT